MWIIVKFVDFDGKTKYMLSENTDPEWCWWHKVSKAYAMQVIREGKAVLKEKK